ncbi:hypothetical protein D3C84_901260 [compost metagenome]
MRTAKLLVCLDAQINAVNKEANPIFITGSMPDYPKYVEETKKKLVDAGIDKIMAEIQKQYDEWKAANK